MTAEEEENWRERADSLEDAVAAVPCLKERKNNREDSLNDGEKEVLNRRGHQAEWQKVQV